MIEKNKNNPNHRKSWSIRLFDFILEEVIGIETVEKNANNESISIIDHINKINNIDHQNTNDININDINDIERNNLHSKADFDENEDMNMNNMMDSMDDLYNSDSEYIDYKHMKRIFNQIDQEFAPHTCPSMYNSMSLKNCEQTQQFCSNNATPDQSQINIKTTQSESVEKRKLFVWEQQQNALNIINSHTNDEDTQDNNNYNKVPSKTTSGNNINSYLTESSEFVLVSINHDRSDFEFSNYSLIMSQKRVFDGEFEVL